MDRLLSHSHGPCALEMGRAQERQGRTLDHPELYSPCLDQGDLLTESETLSKCRVHRVQKYSLFFWLKVVAKEPLDVFWGSAIEELSQMVVPLFSSPLILHSIGGQSRVLGARYPHFLCRLAFYFIIFHWIKWDTWGKKIQGHFYENFLW